ncbi:MAG TPA: AMP-binding protein [Gemmatimonadales bacterium]
MTAEIVWTPPDALIEAANVTRFMRRHRISSAGALRARSVADPVWFWDAVVNDLGIQFSTPYHAVRDMSAGAPWTEWFLGGRLNLAANCLDRHAPGAAARTAVIAEREDGAVRTLTYAHLRTEVARCAGALRASGIVPGDRVAAYMPMTADVAIQMLATTSVGAIFIPIFSGYAPAALAERLQDSGAKLLFTADGTRRRGTILPIKGNADAAVLECPAVERVVMARYTGEDVAWREDRDVTWDDFLDRGEPTDPVPCGSMDPAIMLYTSGTTGRPKGTLHSHAGALVQIAKEAAYVFDLKPDDRFFWLTDIGWMMGPWQIIGGLFQGATVVIYDGAWDWPRGRRLWEMLERHRVTVSGMSPTAVRLAMREGVVPREIADLRSLRLLGSTGEPWDDRSWTWYFTAVGGSARPIMNISGGTDLIGSFVSPLPLDSLKASSVVAPGLGMDVDVWDESGAPVRGEVGYLVCKQPAPSMTRGLWNAPDRYLESYWAKFPGVWNHGDWARIDGDGFWYVQGRADDTLKVAGRRIGPSEVEGALIATGKVSEAAAIGVPHEITGQAIVCFAVLRPGHAASEALAQALAQAVVERVGKIDRPERIVFVNDLPKTRSAKILRRMIRAKYLGEALGDLASVQNPEALEEIAARS